MLSSIEDDYVIILGKRKQILKIWVMTTILLVNIHGKNGLQSISVGMLE